MLATQSRSAPRPPDLAALDLDQAASLEQIALEALVGFVHRRGELGGRVRRSAPHSPYATGALGQLDRVRRLEAMARMFGTAARARAVAAERERCIAVRAVAALARAALGEAPHRAEAA